MRCFIETKKREDMSSNPRRTEFEPNYFSSVWTPWTTVLTQHKNRINVAKKSSANDSFVVVFVILLMVSYSCDVRARNPCEFEMFEATITFFRPKVVRIRVFICANKTSRFLFWWLAGLTVLGRVWAVIFGFAIVVDKWRVVWWQENIPAVALHVQKQITNKHTYTHTQKALWRRGCAVPSNQTPKLKQSERCIRAAQERDFCVEKTPPFWTLV